MKINAVNQWLALLANLGVVLGLAALALEINQSNRIAQREAREANADSIFEVSELIVNSPELMAVQLKLRDPNIELNDLESEYAKHLAAMYISTWGKLRIQYSTGLLPAGSLRFGIQGISDTMHTYPGLAPFVADYFERRSVKPNAGHLVWDDVWQAVHEVMQ